MTNLCGEKQDGVILSKELITESLSSSSSSKNEDESPALELSNHSSSSGATVRVLNAVCIPGCHYCMVQAHIDQNFGTADTPEMVFRRMLGGMSCSLIL